MVYPIDSTLAVSLYFFFNLKAILRGGSDVGSSGGSGSASRTLSPSPPQHGSPRPTSGAPPVISHPRPIGQLVIPADSLTLGTHLGDGDFGSVHQAVWTSDGREKVTVAAKTLHQDMLSGDLDILTEAGPIHELDHECLVRLYGVVHDQEDMWILVSELAPQGSLLDLLRDQTKRADVPLPRLCDYAQQVCDGMTYLERRGIVHRDLAARNILVFAPGQVKIGDIGLSKMLAAGPDSPDSNFWYSSKNPVAWYAPETIKSSEFSPASDVWSFGVVLWEMFSYGRQPWAELTSGQVMEVVDEPSCERLEQPELCTGDIYQLMCQCWQSQSQARPTFASMLLSLPQLRPTQVKALKEYSGNNAEKGYMHYAANEIIVVIDKCPANTSAPRGLVWKGVTSNGTLGLFDPTNVIPFIEPKASPVVSVKTTSLARRESGRKTSKKIRADMISQPQNDLRHTGHIGFDGAMFGDVSFIGDAYNKLPPRLEGSLAGSRMSVQRSQDSPDRNGHVNSFNSDDSLDRNKGTSWLSRDSLNSQSTMQSEQDGRYSPSYLDVEDDSLFSDFKMPDLGSSFDFGPSFMDEVLKALDEKEKQVTENGASGRQVSAPTPAKRETLGSTSSSGTAPTPGPRAVKSKEPPREKKQAKVKPMSASDERMVDAAIARSRELTAHQLTDSHSPPVSPGEGGGVFFDDDSPGLLSKLKNSIKRNGGQEESRQRTFSEELESKGDLDDEVTPEAQQAYNMLVVKGSFKESKAGASPAPSPAVRVKQENSAVWSEEKSSSYRNDSVVPTPQNRQQPQQHHQYQQPQQQHPYSNSGVTRIEPDLIRDSKRGVTPPRVSAPIAISSPIPQVSAVGSDQGPAHVAPVPASRPTISAPTSPPPPIPSKATPPVPAPRPVVKSDSTKRSEIPIPRPRPEIQRVEPTIRQTVAPPASPDIPPKKIESHIPVVAHPKEREREELKRTIEIVRITDTDSGSFRDDLSDRAASTSFDRSSARSSQRSSLDKSDNLSENAESERADWEQSECSSDSSNHRRFGGTGNGGLSGDFERGDHRGISSGGGYSSYTASVERRDSLTKKQGGNGTTSSSLFEEDLSEPSPQEIMSKLRERRLNRQMDHQRALASAGGGDGTAEPTPGITRNRPSAREPQGIPGRTPSIDLEEGGGGGGDSGQPDEVDTNPLRMLRGGAIPIRTAGGRSSASGTGNHGNQGAAVASTGGPAALQVPLLNLSSSSPLCRSTDEGNGQPDEGVEISSTSTTHAELNSARPVEGDGMDDPALSEVKVTSAPASEVGSETTAAAEVAKELELLTSTLMEGDLAKVASAVVDAAHSSFAHPVGSGSTTTVEGELDKFSASGHMLKFDPPQISSTTASSTQVTSVVVTTMSTSASSQHATSAVSSLPSSPSSSSSLSSSVVRNAPSAEPLPDVVLGKPLTLSLQPKPTLLPTAVTPTAEDSSDSSDEDVWIRRDQATPENLAIKEEPSPVGEVPCEAPTAMVADLQITESEKKEEPEEVEEWVAPPRLPPRRSMSMSENPEHTGNSSRSVPGPRVGVRRSSSTVDAQELPALPPREPQPWRTPLNARPRERKFPLLVHPPSSSPPSHPNTPSPPTSAGSSPRRVMPKCPIYNTPRSSWRRSPESSQQSLFSNSLQGLSLHANTLPPSRPARLSPNPSLPPKQHSLPSSPFSHPTYPTSPCASLSPTSPHHHFLHPSDTTSSVELPPTYDISISPEFETGSPVLHKTDRDTEPTHMLLDPHSSHKPAAKIPRRPVPPPLAMSLPPSKDLTLSDEPTHVALSSLAQNKLSWSASFPSPSPLSPSFQHPSRQTGTARTNAPDPSSRLSKSPSSSVSSPPRTFSRSASHTCAPTRIPLSLTHQGHLGEDAGDNLSPPADLPPAPPTPSYRQKLGLDAGGRPSMVRSFSHNPAVSGRGSPNFVYGDSGGQHHSLDMTASRLSPRVTSPSFRHQSHLSPTPLPSSSPTTQQVFPPSPFLRGASLSPPPRPPALGSTHHRAPPPPPPASSPQQQLATAAGRTPAAQHVFQFPANFSSTSTRAGNSIQTSSPLLNSNPAANLSVSSRQGLPQGQGHTDHSHDGEEEEAEVSPLMFTGFSATSSASYEDLQQFSLERQKNCEEIEELLKTFPNEVTVAECMTALEGTRWDVARARKYLQLKKLLSLRLADVHRCKAALVATGWDIQRAADWLLDTNRSDETGETAGAALGVRELRGGGREEHTDSGSPSLAASSLSSSSSSMSSASGPLNRNSPLRATVPAGRVSSAGTTPRRPTTPEAVDM
ncbi:tyrosine-protein kinase PR2 [Elysia marginata]|uniref:Tyrosine-protein kinase PR2 n=1 Tax=Elysia marginata TaxID=1093978 RepID=A0AAV4I6B8_9GAST|nr:tyrosine-protein kinase PR2 [Elysia marginata]